MDKENSRDRIDELEQEKQDIKIQISERESMLQQKSDETGSGLSEDAWGFLTDRRTFTTDMSTTDALKAFGEPLRISTMKVMARKVPNGS